MNMRKFMFLVFFSVILIAIVSAENTLDEKQMSAVYNDLECKTDFIIGTLNQNINFSNANVSSINETGAKLTDDLTQLKIYADSGEREQFRSYIRTNYEPDFRALKTSILQWR